jgi:hypothetical protein
MTSLDDSLLGPVADADRRRWQMASSRALGEILKRADKRKLKPLTWHLGTALVGHVNATDYGNIDQAVTAVFGQWCELLHLTADEPVAKSGGGLYLAGRHTCWRPRPNLTGCRITVIAQTFKL